MSADPGSSFSQHLAEPQVDRSSFSCMDVAPEGDQQPRLPSAGRKAADTEASNAGSASQLQQLHAEGQAGCSYSSPLSHHSQHAHAPAPAGSVAINMGPASDSDVDVVRAAAPSDQRHPALHPASPVAATRLGSNSSENDFVIIELQPSTGDGQPGHAAVLTPPAAAAAAADPSSDSANATSLRARLQALRVASLARRSMSAASAAASSVADSQQEQRECRICLAADCQADIVTPCSCSGSVQYAHLECLKAWVAERCSLQCELCGKQYRPEVKQQLEQVIDPRKLRARQRRAAAAAAANGNAGAGGDLRMPYEDSEGDAEPQPQISWTRFWVHLGVLVMLLVAVLYLSLFVNVGASDNFWLMFLWRAITVILPLFLIIRCVAALYTWRQQYMAAAAARASSG